MKLRSFFVAIVFCFSICLTSCVGCSNDYSNDQAAAYFKVFEKLYEESKHVNDKYVGLDLSEAKLKDTSGLVAKMKEFCEKNNYVLLVDDYEGLKEKGYIENLMFKDGILISFSDKKLSKNVLVTSGQVWYSGLGAFGADYTVKKSDGTWHITKTENLWYS